MYNRFLPCCPPPPPWCGRPGNTGTARPQKPPEPPPPPPEPPQSKSSGFSLSGLLQRFNLKELDKGDLLLMLILMLLFSEEGDGKENLLVIALAFLLA